MRLRLPFIFLFILVLFIVVILYQSLFEKKNYIPKNINNKIENILIKEFNTNNNFFLKNLLEDKKIKDNLILILDYLSNLVYHPDLTLQLKAKSKT